MNFNGKFYPQTSNTSVFLSVFVLFIYKTVDISAAFFSLYIILFSYTLLCTKQDIIKSRMNSLTNYSLYWSQYYCLYLQGYIKVTTNSIKYCEIFLFLYISGAQNTNFYMVDLYDLSLGQYLKSTDHYFG